MRQREDNVEVGTKHTGRITVGKKKGIPRSHIMKKENMKENCEKKGSAMIATMEWFGEEGAVP